MFTGRERDSETGLDYFGARYYGSNIAGGCAQTGPRPQNLYHTLISPIPQTLNLYGYVRNNPLYKAGVDGLGWDVIRDYFLRAANAYRSDNLSGCRRVEQTSSAGRIGAGAGMRPQW